jgi:hypothetical protein
MERHSVDEADAFGMLRDHSRRTKHQSRRRRRCRRRLSAATQPAEAVEKRKDISS